MATELEVSKSRRFDIAMSRRTRRSASLVACFQDQYVPSLAQQRHQELKAFLQRQDEDQLTPCPDEEEELKIPQASLQYEDDEQKTPKQYQGEQEKKSQQYSGEEKKEPEHYQGEKEKKPEQHKDEEEKTPEPYPDEDEQTSQYKDEALMTPSQRENDEEMGAERFEDPEQVALQQRQEADEEASEQSEEDEEEEQKSEQKEPEQFQGLKKLPPPPRAIDNVPRFSLQELIQQKQLQTGEAMARPTNKLRVRGHGESVLPADHKVPGSGGGAAGGTTLAMVIKRPDGGKKSMGMIRRCVKALNQMIKTKHGSKKNLHL